MTNLKLVSGAGSLARAAYLRTKELMSAVMDDYLEVVRSASREYEALPVNERSEYCRLCGWTEQTVKDFRRTLENYPNNKIDEVIGFCKAVGLPISLEKLGIKDMSPANLIKAAKLVFRKGSFIKNLSFEATPQLVMDAIVGANALGVAFQSRI